MTRAGGMCAHGSEGVCWACTLPAVVLHCPHLGRDMRHILSHVQHAQILTGEKTVPGEAGCLEMHKAAVRLAIERGWDRVWVLEDDCAFTPAFSMSLWEGACRAAHAAGADTVFGGTVRAHDSTVLVQMAHTALIGVSRCCSAHCVVHYREGYEAVLKSGQPFDLQLGVQGARCAVVWPFVAIQRAGLSGIGMPVDQGDSTRYTGPSVVNYEGLFAGYERALGDMMGLGVVA